MLIAQVPLNLDQFLQKYPILFKKLCFWARRRGVENPAAQVQEYLTELIVEADEDGDNTLLLRKWFSVLSPQERVELVRRSPITISDYPNGDSWYSFNLGEYSVVTEPVLQEIYYKGQLQGFITRNRYNCEVLNCDRMLIIDVDICSPWNDEIQDCAKSSQIAMTQRQAISAVKSLTEQFPKLGFRVYRTRNGLRHVCTTQPFDPLDPATYRLMQSFYVDPLYARLCKFQSTFRARLTPKPWRVDEDYAERFVYDRVTRLVLPEPSNYAVCYLIDIIGNKKIIHEFEPLIQTHDSYCHVNHLSLELA
ncbi:hypothetical protein H6G89_20465 [Oscillatoria sp. FACHB-1407]|uniref:hypothetical protein n=1 Tax=Oscillatoria sp. FACHB-1407 TaxID=2692847 RepID=UPI001685D846|nr:hypothetical protein [Oscillatoria sp. FACHB-1407]MBD2463410.1 hypothetical protein [Oscillatoria sp. FACHB-1407]